MRQHSQFVLETRVARPNVAPFVIDSFVIEGLLQPHSETAKIVAVNNQASFRVKWFAHLCRVFRRSLRGIILFEREMKTPGTRKPNIIVSRVSRETSAAASASLRADSEGFRSYRQRSALCKVDSLICGTIRTSVQMGHYCTAMYFSRICRASGPATKAMNSSRSAEGCDGFTR